MLLLAVVALTAGGCSSTEVEGPADTSAATVCAHFRSVVTETAAGNVTEQELRDEFVDILGEAEAASADDLAEAARRVVSSLNAGDMVGFEQAFRDTDAACVAAGF